MALGLDLAELSRSLKQERLFVTSEREQLQNLFEQVTTTAEQLYHQSWISRQQKDVLDSMIGSSKEVTAVDGCLKTNQLESTNFIDWYKYLTYHDSKYGEFLKFLLETPRLVGQILAAEEKASSLNTYGIVKILMHSVYGNCVLQEDETRMLHMLKCLLELQLATCNNPRLMLRRGSCAFSIACRQLFDVLFSTKLFLTGALHDPVMRLLMEDEWFYDIDPGKALVRFPASERQRRFGEPGTEQYKEKLAKYRTTIVEKLVIMANRFIISIKNNMHCFPTSLAWLVSQVYQTLTKTGKLEISEVRSVCSDLVFALFICPAICDPEPHGITTDVQISHIARHNLMQMAQIIQTLAISRWDEIDPKQLDLYNKFEKGILSSLLDSLVDGLGLELPSDTSNTQLPCLARTSSLITVSQLNTLISYLRTAMPQVSDSSDKKLLDEILSGLSPISPPTPVQNQLPPSINTSATPPGTPNVSKRNKHKKKASVVSMMSQHSDDALSVSSLSLEPETQNVQQVEDVLVISLGNDIECPGMMSEQKVLSYEQENKRRRVKYQAVPGGYEVGTAEIQEKRTRFSLSHDQESIGNTSDIQEAISEGASSHSVGSQDLENDDNDNFSDMISANVSGRGTPNISGRDTPLSQAESGEQEPQPHPQPALPETIQKKNRVDVTEKFGKFEIKQELEYDLKSTVSDTWSTDVLASDSEPPEMNQQVRLEEIAEEMVRQHMLGTQEVSETASDAWSTDVLASDTEEKQVETLSEFDDLSMAEMGGNLDEVRSESDIAEVTPLASGFQSPSDNGDQYQGAAAGGSVKSENMSMSPTFSDNVFSDSETERAVGSRIEGDGERRPSSGSRSDRLLMGSPVGIGSNRLFVPIKKKRDSSPTGTSNDRYKAGSSGGFMTNLANRHTDQWPGIRPMSAPGTYRDVSSELQNLHTASNLLSLGDTGARPKSQNNLNVNSNKEPLLSKNRFNEDSVRNEGDDFRADLFRQVPKGRISADSGVSSAQFLDISESKENVTLCQQQNTNLSEEKISAALSLFDPLSPSKETTDGDLLEGAGCPHEHAFRSYQGKDLVPDCDRTDALVTTVEKQKSNQFMFDTTPTDTRESEAISAINQAFLPTSVATNHRRTSTDSIQSSESGNSKEDSGQGDKSEQTSLENSTGAVVTNGKDPTVGEETSTPGRRKGLFRTFKDKIHKVVDVTSQTAAGIKKKGNKHDKESTPEKGHIVDGAIGGEKQATLTPEPNIIITQTETSDDILAKYRKKSILASTPNNEPMPTEKERRLTLKDSDDPTPLYDPSNLENCLAFLDAKRKLRIVLSSGDFQVSHGVFSGGLSSYSPREVDGPNRDRTNDLVNLLRTQLSEAINLQNRDTIAQLHEAIRCVRMFDTEGCKKLVRCLQEDYSARSSYISYLVRCKQGLLSTLSQINRLHSRMKREKEIYNRHLTNVCVRMFLESWEKHMMAFISEFQKLTVSDEKTDLVERFLQYLYQQVNKDPIWNAATETQLDDARLAIERLIMSRIYTQAMFPNGDGDVDRDKLIQSHIKQLSKIISPNHKDLRIPKTYHLECPWPAAQREIFMINAYKTPNDKLKCVHRCATTIMNLLRLANEKSVPAADDFMPVFIFVIIKANPPCLLSTIQYVNSFYGNRIHGEEQYWWMQFCGAVEFIKTMDYTVCNSSEA